jgi:pimeloyl-ACP methyl ester carboxylesterase
VALYVEALGDPRGPAIVFLHGVGASGWMWWRQLPAFADHLCLNVDLPGHGRSSDVPWVSLAETADQVAALVGARSRTGTAHVVGLSLGGHVALELLDHHHDVVDRAVLSGVTAEPWPRRWLLGPQLRLTTAMLRSRRLVAAQARALGLPPEAQVAFAEGVRAMSPATYRRIGVEVACYRVPSSLATVVTPTLVLAGGKESEMIRAAVRVIPALMPRAAGRVVPGVGHGWNVEAAEEFNATVRAWTEA